MHILWKRLAVGLLWLISLMPFRVLYFFSDFLSFLLFRVFKYREKVVLTNLKKAFPDKNPDDIKQIAKKFYRNFSDLILEVIKIRNLRKKTLQERITFKNYRILEDLYAKNKSVIVTIGHCGNWEWMSMALEMITGYRAFAIVKPLNDAYFDRYLTKLRKRFNSRGGLIQFKSAFREMVRNKNELTLTIFAGDQTPTRDEINYRTRFLNQETPVFLGVEKIARSLGFPVVFFNIQRSGRGHYEVEITTVSEFPKETSEYEITEKHVRLLEQKIAENPDNWLWSHRRWKHAGS
ncbi:MAG: lysophospholipid acyltransferase family protein [Bacteroidales bacterium]|nr:lysophospholipid acyltransferase family protein [Bacteroidales bacterium]